MSEPEVPYVDPSPSRGEEAAPAEGCRVCGGLHMYPLDEAVGSKRCIDYLRSEIGTLQGDVLALRLQLAAKPAPKRPCQGRHPGWGLCTRRRGHPPPHSNHISGGRWEDPPASAAVVPSMRTPEAEANPEPICHSDCDGDCTWEGCPQLRDDEPLRTGRHCPLDIDDPDF